MPRGWPGAYLRGRATGEFEDDPNLTDKKFPGNPTQSFRTREPLRIVGELVDWVVIRPRGSRPCGAARDESQQNGTAQIED